MTRTKARLDEQMGRIVERNLLQQEETSAKRARVSDASSSNQSPASLAQPSLASDTCMDDQSKRVAESGIKFTPKKPRAQSDSTEVSYCERMMQEDFT